MRRTFQDNKSHGTRQLSIETPKFMEETQRFSRKNGIQYYVLWKGYPLKEATWEPEENLEHSQETLNEYWTLQEQKNQCKRKVK